MNFFAFLLSADFLKIAIPAAGAIIAWILNERGKARNEQLQRKEERYKELLRSVKGFYAQSQDLALKARYRASKSLLAVRTGRSRSTSGCIFGSGANGTKSAIH